MAETQTNQDQIRYWNEESGLKWVRNQQRLDAQIEPLGLVAMQRADIRREAIACRLWVWANRAGLGKPTGRAGQLLASVFHHPCSPARERQQELKRMNLEFIAADAQTYAFASDRFDLIFRASVCSSGTHRCFRNLRSAPAPLTTLLCCWQELAKNDWARVP
jgi:hypothetical protein